MLIVEWKPFVETVLRCILQQWWLKSFCLYIVISLIVLCYYCKNQIIKDCCSMMDFEWKPSVETIFLCITTFSGQWNICDTVNENNKCWHQYMMLSSSRRTKNIYYIILTVLLGLSRELAKIQSNLYFSTKLFYLLNRNGRETYGSVSAGREKGANCALIYFETSLLPNWDILRQ